MENNGKSREVAVLQSKLLKIQWQADLIHLGLGKPWKKEAEEDPQPNNAHNALSLPCCLTCPSLPPPSSQSSHTPPPHSLHMVGARPVVSRQSPDELTHHSASVAPSQDRQQPVVATRSGLWPFCPHMPSGLMSGLGPLWLIPDGGWKYCALFLLLFRTNVVIVHTFCPHMP